MRLELERLVEALEKTRKYASWFDWPEKERKELGVVSQLVESISSAGLGSLREPRINRPDPPDCVCLNENGDQIAVEVTELVCKQAAKLSAMGYDVYRIWEPGQVTAYVSEALHDKDEKDLHGGPYRDMVVCLFTDEPALEYAPTERELAQARFGPFKQITRAFLLFSYDPSLERLPLIRLNVCT